MKLLLENWRQYLAENKKTTILPGPVKLYTSGLYSSNMETVTVGKKGQEVEIVSGWQDQGVEFKLINVDGIEGWVEADAIDIDDEIIEEKDDACTRKVKSRYKVWPSAYASGALVKCRKVGAANWGNKSKKNEAANSGKFSPLKEKKKKAGAESSKESSLHDWFGRKGAKGKKKGWVDCNTCRKDKKTGKKTCKSCGRSSGEDRSKYPSCRPTPGACDEKGKGKSWGKKAKKENRSMTKNELYRIISEEVENALALQESNQEYYEVDALDENEEYCPVCVETMDEAKKKACKPSKGKRFAKRVDGKCRSYGQSGQAKGGGDRIRPGTKKGDAYCARSAGIKKCKNPPCANTLSRKKWKCRGKKSMKQE